MSLLRPSTWSSERWAFLKGFAVASMIFLPLGCTAFQFANTTWRREYDHREVKRAGWQNLAAWSLGLDPELNAEECRYVAGSLHTLADEPTRSEADRKRLKELAAAFFQAADRLGPSERKPVRLKAKSSE
jgi:hypothetical protein